MAGEEGMLTYFLLEGSLIYVDDDNAIGYDDVLSITKLYHEYCSEHGIESVDLDY